VQGQLLKRPVAVTIDSQCAHCAKPMRLHIDSDLDYRSEDALDPVVYLPIVDFRKLKAPNILEDF